MATQGITRASIPTNTATRYEIVLTAPDGRAWRIPGWTCRTTRQALLETMQASGQQVLALLPHEGDFGIKWNGKVKRFEIEGGWTVGFGRTQRDAATLGHLPMLPELS